MTTNNHDLFDLTEPVIAELVDVLAVWGKKFEDEEDFGRNEEEWAFLVDLLRRTEQQVNALRTVVEIMRSKIVSVMPSRFEHDGRLFEKRAKMSTSWDHPRVLSAVFARAIEESGGEIAQVETILRDCAGIQYWKVGGLKKYGLDADQFRTKERTGWSIVVTDAAGPLVVTDTGRSSESNDPSAAREGLSDS